MLGLTEDSMDTPSIGSDFAHTSSPIPMSNMTPVASKRPAAFTGGKSGKKVITGYILYSSEVRKTKVGDHPEMKFGEISRMIGDEWRALPTVERRQWEDRASTINETNATKYAEEMALNGNVNKESSSPTVILTPNQLSMQHEFVNNQVKCHFLTYFCYHFCYLPLGCQVLTNRQRIQRQLLFLFALRS